MWFIAHVESYNSTDNKIDEDKMLIKAKTYPEAMEYIDFEYGKILEKVTLIEAISDGDILFLTDEGEAEIREHPFNDF